MSDSLTTNAAGPRKRPGVITAIGVITIVFCSIGIVTVLYNVIGSLVMGGPEQLMARYRGLYQTGGMNTRDLYDKVFNVTARYASFTLIFNMVGLVLAGIGLIGGILILKTNPISLPLLRAYGVINLVYVTGSLIMSIALLSEIQGVMMEFISSMDMPRGMEHATAGLVQFAIYIGIILGAVFEYAWPIVLLALLNGRKIKEFFGKQPAAQPV